MLYHGGCHCGDIRFEVDAPEDPEVVDCNCSICTKSGYLHLIVPQSRFSLLAGTNQLQTYTFNSGVAKHYFCKRCGIKSFYVPRSNPDGIDVNVRCLDDGPLSMKIIKFDGENWERHAHTLAHKSRETG
ncbi:MAG: GFA family protein [Gammaproteobacteria bacterium]